MNAAFTPTRMRITIDRYQKMVASGVLTPRDRVELIEGEILDMAPVGTRHASVTRRLHKQLVLAVGDDLCRSGAGRFPANPRIRRRRYDFAASVPERQNYR
jgi:Uma2 family endonuclease